jgi:hypothetical protein
MKYSLPTLFILLSSVSMTQAAISLSGPSGGAGWVSLGQNFDYVNDQQTGDPASDIVGNATDSGFFIAFDGAGTESLTDGFLGFRVRLDAAGGTTNSPKFDRSLWVGIDADLNGSIDAFIGVYTPGQNVYIGIFDSGTGANTSPNTTTIGSVSYSYDTSAANYSYRMVTYLTDGGTTNDLSPGTTGDPDYYLSFMVPFADIAAFITSQLPTFFDSSNPFNEYTPLRYVVGTSTQNNSLNQDLGGIDNKTANLGSSWESLGGFSSTVAVSGVLVPECSAGLLAFVGSVIGSGFRRRR